MPPTKRKHDFQETPISNEDEDENSRNPPVPPPAETPISEGFPSNLPEITTSRGPIDNQDQDDYSFPELTEDHIQLLKYFLGEGSSSQQPAPAAESPSILDQDNDFLVSFHGDPPPPPPFSTDFDNQTFPDVKYYETFLAETAKNLPPATTPVEPLPFKTLGNIWSHLSVKQLIDLVMVGMKHADITEMVLEMVDTIPSLRTMYVKCHELDVSQAVLLNTLNRYGEVEDVQLLSPPLRTPSLHIVLFKKRQSLVQAFKNPVINISSLLVEFGLFEMPDTSLGVIDENILKKLSLKQLQNLASTAAQNHFEVTELVYKLAETLPVLCTLHIYGLDKDLGNGFIVDAMSVYGDVVEFLPATGSHNPQELCTICFRKRKSLLEAMKEPQKIIGGKVVYCKPKSL